MVRLKWRSKCGVPRRDKRSELTLKSISAVINRFDDVISSLLIKLKLKLDIKKTQNL